ncbi:hypothetical protein [Serratia fonticola]|uniref:hypothetical protein n=1 Tax=Serratia fonticola TaxID=47917 RepID=UPI0034C664F3
MSDKLEALKAVERFDAEIEIHGGESFAVWSPVPSGSHVSAKDYDALLAALEEKDQEVNQLKSDYQKLAQEHRFLANESARKGIRNAELEQRLQQPIKLPKREIGMACEFVSDHIVVSLAAVLAEAATAGFNAEVEGE